MTQMDPLCNPIARSGRVSGTGPWVVHQCVRQSSYTLPVYEVWFASWLGLTDSVPTSRQMVRSQSDLKLPEPWYINEWQFLSMETDKFFFHKGFWQVTSHFVLIFVSPLRVYSPKRSFLSFFLSNSFTPFRTRHQFHNSSSDLVSYTPSRCISPA